jgi:hypothetical protein
MSSINAPIPRHAMRLEKIKIISSFAQLAVKIKNAVKFFQITNPMGIPIRIYVPLFTLSEEKDHT